MVTVKVVQFFTITGCRLFNIDAVNLLCYPGALGKSVLHLNMTTESYLNVIFYLYVSYMLAFNF